MLFVMSSAFLVSFHARSRAAYFFVSDDVLYLVVAIKDHSTFY